MVYNVGASGADAYAGTGVITPSGMTVGIDTDSSSTSADRVSLSGTGMQFVQPSPTQRIYLVETPVSYLCDTSAGTLTRHEGHPLAATQLTTAASLTAAGATSAALARQVTSCAFTYQNGTTERGGLVLLDLTLADGPEQVRLLLQAHVDNLP